MGSLAQLYFLPGMMCDDRLFSSQIQSLSAECDCHCLSFSQGDSMQDYALQVAQRLAPFHENKSSCNILIGLSMGGIVTMQCMAMFPDRIDAVVLMDTNPLAEDVSRKALRLPQVKRALNGELDSILIEEMKPLYLAPQHQDNEALLSLVLNMARELGPSIFARQSKAIMNRRDNSQVLGNWKKPTLLLYGEHDKLCPPERHQYMKRLMPHSTIVAIDDAGHLPTLEAPTKVNAELKKFIDHVLLERV